MCCSGTKPLTGHWSGTQPGWYWHGCRWWWPVCQWSPPRGWQSWFEPLTSNGSRWSWCPDGQWCSRWAEGDEEICEKRIGTSEPTWAKTQTAVRNKTKSKVAKRTRARLTSFGMVSSWEPVCAEVSIPAEEMQRKRHESVLTRWIIINLQSSRSLFQSVHLPWKPWLLCAMGKGLCCMASWWSLVSCCHKRRKGRGERAKARVRTFQNARQRWNYLFFAKGL